MKEVNPKIIPITILGIAGTGKTRTLISKLSNYKNLRRVVFISYARSVIKEAKERAIKLGYEEKDLIYFRTFHSLAAVLLSRLGALSNEPFLTKDNKKDFFGKIKVRYIPEENDLGETNNFKLPQGNRILHIHSKARHVAITSDINDEKYKEVVEKSLRSNEDISPFLYYETIKLYEAYKKSLEKLDYTDTILKFVDIAEKENIKDSFSFEAILVDEAHNISPLIARMIILLTYCLDQDGEFIVAGDDPQAIYNFTGASEEFFKKMVLLAEPLGKHIILKTSYRVPKLNLKIMKGLRKLYNFLPADDVISKTEEQGEYGIISTTDELIDLLDDLLKRGSIVIQTFTNEDKQNISKFLRENGFIYEIIGKYRDLGWNEKLVVIHNAILKIIKKEPLTKEELAILLVDVIPRKKVGVEDKKEFIQNKFVVPSGDKSKFVGTIIKEYKMFPIIDYNKGLFTYLVKVYKDSLKKGSIPYEIYSNYGTFFENPIQYISNLKKRVGGAVHAGDLLKEKLSKGDFSKISLPIPLKIATIHGFQGREADYSIIYLNKDPTFQWDTEKKLVKLIYVAISRNKKSMYLYGRASDFIVDYIKKALKVMQNG